MSAFPALGFDPAPGNAGEVARLGRETARVAGELHDLDRELQRLGSIGPAWRGAAGECFRGAVGELPVHLRRAEESFAYVGCLVIRLDQCRELYQRVEGT